MLTLHCDLFKHLNSFTYTYYPGGRGVSVWLGLLLGREGEGRSRAPGVGSEARGPGVSSLSSSDLKLQNELSFVILFSGVRPRLDQQQDPERAHDGRVRRHRQVLGHQDV